MGSAQYIGAILQYQGALIGVLLGLGWVLAGFMRSRELKRRRERRGLIGSQLPHKGQPSEDHPISKRGRSRVLANLEACSRTNNAHVKSKWPGISVVLPVKGCRKHSLQNWESQLRSRYSGPIEYLFIVDSQADPAFPAISRLLESRPGANAKILVSSRATCTSQKICNLQTGIKCADVRHKWILCLDDDVLLHPTTLDDLVAAAEADPSSFMVTGYPFDVPEAGASLLTYCCLVYHLPLVIAFSVRQRTSFVWGGCMLLPLEELRLDTHGIMQSWSQGGYSDDLTVAAVCSERGLPILCPSFAIFPQWLDKERSLRQFWNYLRRQLFVMDTYASCHNRRLNHTMLALHCYLSWAFVVPCAISLLEAAKCIYQSIFLGAHAAAAPSLPCLAFFGAFLGAHASLLWMTGTILDLFSVLDCSQCRVPMAHFSWLKLWLGFCITNAVLPVCAVYTWLTPDIVWSGVQYHKHNGRIVRVQHPNVKQ